MYIYVNGKQVHSQEAKISIYDHGYLYGMGVFETFRTYNGVPFLLDDHLDRLESGCRQMGIKWERNRDLLLEQINQLLKVNQLKDAYFRYNISAGPGAIGLPAETYEEATESLFIKELPPEINSKKLATLQIRRNTPEGAWRLKSHHYLNNILAKRETPANHEGVFLSEQGYVAEGIVSNLFFVREGKLYTPALSTGILNGITREWVLATSRHLSIPVEEGEYRLEFAQEAEEVFVTNSIQELVFVEEWDGKRYGEGLTPSVYLCLKDYYDRCKGHLLKINQLANIIENGKE